LNEELAATSNKINQMNRNTDVCIDNAATQVTNNNPLIDTTIITIDADPTMIVRNREGLYVPVFAYKALCSSRRCRAPNGCIMLKVTIVMVLSLSECTFVISYVLLIYTLHTVLQVNSRIITIYVFFAKISYCVFHC
jgi:hypothetical protein